MMNVDTYYVALCKDGYPLYIVAGPFNHPDEAGDAMEKLPEQTGRCYYGIFTASLELKEY